MCYCQRHLATVASQYLFGPVANIYCASFVAHTSDVAILQPVACRVSSCVMVMAVSREFGEVSALTGFTFSSSRWALSVRV